MSKCTEESFLKSVVEHKMHIINDSGLTRHIRFRRERSSDMQFDIVMVRMAARKATKADVHGLSAQDHLTNG